MVELEITKRTRNYGYVYWNAYQDEEMSKLFGKRNIIDVVFMGAEHGAKKIDWKYRRISIGVRWIRSLPESKKVFVLEILKANKLEIQCR